MRMTSEAGTCGRDAQKFGGTGLEVTEVTLLLPSDRMKALVDLSKRQGESVGQILRRLIDRELATQS